MTLQLSRGSWGWGGVGSTYLTLGTANPHNGLWDRVTTTSQMRKLRPRDMTEIS